MEKSAIMRVSQHFLKAAAFSLLLLGGSAAFAENVTPDFANGTAGWATDRYAPASFANIGTFQGLNNVLQIGISNADGAQNRPPAYSSAFYNTQGKSIGVSGVLGDHAAVLLYVPSSWADPNNGNVRTDEWLVLNDASNAISAYPVLGFTNYGAGGARFRGWDTSVGAWVDFTSASINYDRWNILDITLDPAGSVTYSVNTVAQATFAGDPLALNATISTYMLQAYNFNDSSLGANHVNYQVDYANTPEPGTWGMMLLSLGGVAFVARKRAAVRS